MLWHLLCLYTSESPARLLCPSQDVGWALSLFSLLSPLLTMTSSPYHHRRERESINHTMDIFQRIPSSFQVPHDLPVPSLPSISDFYLFLSWSCTSRHQHLHSPPSALTQSLQPHTFFVWPKFIQAPELLLGLFLDFLVKSSLNKNSKQVKKKFPHLISDHPEKSDQNSSLPTLGIGSCCSAFNKKSIRLVQPESLPELMSPLSNLPAKKPSASWLWIHACICWIVNEAQLHAGVYFPLLSYSWINFASTT